MSSLHESSIRTRITGIVTHWTVVIMESVAQLSIGQTILRFIDRFLWTVEKSSEWSLPSQHATSEENGKSFGETTLVRPLPWIFFLPVLILLRILRSALNVGASILDFPKLEAIEIVKYLQKSRRRLRTIKSNGMKSMRQRRDCSDIRKGCGRPPNAASSDDTDDKCWSSIELLRTIRITLSSLSCLDGGKSSSPSPPPMRIKVTRKHESTPTPEEQSTTESASSPVHAEYKRKYSDLCSDEFLSDDSDVETSFRTKIDRIVALNKSADDHDYRPDELSDNSSNDSSSDSSECDVSATEIEDIRIEANEIFKRSFAGVEAVIKEEPEPVKRVDDERIMPAGLKRILENSTSTADASENYSPFKLDREEPATGDSTAFYSPISSKSSSPDRELIVSPQLEETQLIESKEGKNCVAKTKVSRNGNPNSSNAKAQTPDAHSTDNKTTNGHIAGAKVGTGGATTASNNANLSAATKANKSHYRARKPNNNLPTTKKNK